MRDEPVRERCYVLAESARRFGGAAALGKSDHLKHPNRAVERDGHHIAGPHGAARSEDALAIDAHVT
jgi:hypothetical protein